MLRTKKAVIFRCSRINRQTFAQNGVITAFNILWPHDFHPFSFLNKWPKSKAIHKIVKFCGAVFSFRFFFCVPVGKAAIVWSMHNIVYSNMQMLGEKWHFIRTYFFFKDSNNPAHVVRNITREINVWFCFLVSSTFSHS